MRLGCACGDPEIALYPCEDDQIIFCTHCGAITTRERLINESSTPHFDGQIQWLNVSDRAECPLINVSIPATVRAPAERGLRQAAQVQGLITKISADKCFLRLEEAPGQDGLHRQQEVELLCREAPLDGRMPAVVEESLRPHGNHGPTYYKIRFVPLTLAQKTALENFFQSTCGLQFESFVLLYTPDPAFGNLRAMIRECLPKARVLQASVEAEFVRMAKEFEPSFCLLPVIPMLLESLGHHMGQEHSARPHVIMMLSERNHVTIRDALLWGAEDILYPDSGAEALSRAIQRCRQAEAEQMARKAGQTPHPRPADPSETISRTIVRARPSVNDEDAVRMLCMASETHDMHSSNHLNRLAAYTAAIARQLGLPTLRVAAMATASKLHDVGKLGVPDEILHKTGALTADERRVMQEHTRFGYRILQASSSELMRIGATIALRHHERVDGGGYPDGLSGDKIPLEARIVTVSDVFDALTTQRVYKPAWSNARAIEHLQEEAGRMFSPEVIEAFLRVQAEIERNQLRFLDDFRDVWTERRRGARMPAPPVPLQLEIVMPDQTFRPYTLNGLIQNLSMGGVKVLLQDASQELFTLLVSARRYAKLSCQMAEWSILDHTSCSVVWVDYYAVPDPTECLVGLSFQRDIPELAQMLSSRDLD